HAGGGWPRDDPHGRERLPKLKITEYFTDDENTTVRIRAPGDWGIDRPVAAYVPSTFYSGSTSPSCASPSAAMAK
ncbi:MAG: hypothetical protein WEE20_14940, partial [Bacteroidota bacterium]